MWWRIWIPSWRFFNAVGPAPELLIRTDGDWQVALTMPRPRWYNLFFNPNDNYMHACNNLLERLVVEIRQEIPPTEWVSLQLVRDLAEKCSCQHLGAQKGQEFSFKIMLGSEDVLTSLSQRVAN